MALGTFGWLLVAVLDLECYMLDGVAFIGEIHRFVYRRRARYH